MSLFNSKIIMTEQFTWIIFYQKIIFVKKIYPFMICHSNIILGIFMPIIENIRCRVLDKIDKV